MIEFIWPWLLLLLPVPAVVRRWLPPAEGGGAALWVPDLGRFTADGSGNGEAMLDGRLRPILVLWLIWATTLLAAARPQWLGDPVELQTSGRDLMVAVDISGSMKTEDLTLDGRSATRLEVVKAVLSDFIGRRAGDRIGLILFGSHAYVQAPLTFDRDTVERLLLETPIGIAGGKTAIGDAIGLAVKRLRERPRSHRVLILLTDGANNIGEVEPLRAAELAAEANVRIYTIGVGADAMRLGGLFGFGRLINPAADLDEASLKRIAGTTGGRYFRARDTSSLVEIYDELDKLEPVSQDPELFRPIRQLFHWPLGLALLASFYLAWQRLGVHIGKPRMVLAR